MKTKTSQKFSDENIAFWKKLNVNLIKSDKTDSILSYSNLQEGIVKYFKAHNDQYLELLDYIGKIVEVKNGHKH